MTGRAERTDGPVRRVVVVGGGSAAMSASLWSNRATCRRSGWARGRGRPCATRWPRSASAKPTSSVPAMPRSNRARGSSAGPTGRRRRAITTRSTRPRARPRSIWRRTGCTARTKGRALPTGSIIRRCCATQGWRPSRSSRPNMRAMRTMPIIWTRGNSPRCCGTTASGNWASSMCWAMSCASTWRTMAISRIWNWPMAASWRATCSSTARALPRC